MVSVGIFFRPTFKSGEDAQDDEVVGRFPADALAASEHDHADEQENEGDDVHLGVLLGVKLRAFAVHEHADEGDGDEQLCHEDSVHFPGKKREKRARI